MRKLVPHSPSRAPGGRRARARVEVGGRCHPTRARRAEQAALSILGDVRRRRARADGPGLAFAAALAPGWRVVRVLGARPAVLLARRAAPAAARAALLLAAGLVWRECVVEVRGVVPAAAAAALERTRALVRVEALLARVPEVVLALARPRCAAIRAEVVNA
jgi:hypothetical protein